MATRHSEGAAQAAPNVVAFPERRKGRIRRANGAGAMGRCSLRLFRAVNDGTLPPNVADIDPDRRAPRDERLPERTDALMLAGSLFAVLTRDQREGIRDVLLQLDREGDRTAQRLYNWLDAGRL